MDINNDRFAGGNGSGADADRIAKAVHSREYMESALVANPRPSASAQLVVAGIGGALGGYLLWGGSYGEGLFVFSLTLLLLIIVRRRRGGESDQAAEVLKAEYGIPHCTYTPTPDGFECSYKRLPVGIAKLLAAGGGKDTGAIAALMVLLIGGIAALLYWIFGGTKIIVTRTEVIINGKRLSLRDFGGFHVHHTVKLSGKEDALGVIGCRFGLRSFSFGGAFEEGQAQEVSAALNMHWRRVTEAGQGARVSAEALRTTARPADF